MNSILRYRSYYNRIDIANKRTVESRVFTEHAGEVELNMLMVQIDGLCVFLIQLSGVKYPIKMLIDASLAEM